MILNLCSAFLRLMHVDYASCCICIYPWSSLIGSWRAIELVNIPKLARYCCYKIVLVGSIVDKVFYFLNNIGSLTNRKLKQIL